MHVGPNADILTPITIASLFSTILTPIDPNDPEFSEAICLATPSRLLLDVKRCGLYKAIMKARGVNTAEQSSDRHFS